MKIINIPVIWPADDDFTRIDLGDGVRWVKLTGLPQNQLERKIKGISLSRYRGALEAAKATTSSDVVISHLPSMTAATSTALRLLQKEARHLAFSFNFTQLPIGKRLKFMKYAFRSVEKFVVFSKYEVGLYSEKFGLDPSKLSPLIWTQNVPKICDRYKLDAPNPFFCAIGGEGRDINIIIQAAKIFSDKVNFVIITRPHLVPDFAIPKNVTILANIPPEQAWKIASQSLAVLVPLEELDTCCGHITIVGAKLLGLPILTTSSYATFEYTSGRYSILESHPKDLYGFLQNLEKAIDEQIYLKSTAISNISNEIKFHSRESWGEFLRNFIWE